MRSDMDEVIIERPRLRFPLRAGSAYPRGHLKSRFCRVLEDSPSRESMGGVYREKHLNENLRPLVRFLRSAVGRPWNQVFSEICAVISVRSAVQKHVRDHVRDYVLEAVRVERGRVFATDGYGGVRYRDAEVFSCGRRLRFYVDPASGLLRLAPRRPRPSPFAGWRPRLDPNVRRVLSERREAWCLAGVWYEIELAPIGDDRTALDVLSRAPIDAPPLDGAEDHRWRGLYAAKKRQLGKRELAKLGLKSSP